MVPSIRNSVLRCSITRLRSKPYSVVELKAKMLLKHPQAALISHKTTSSSGKTAKVPTGDRPQSEVWRQLIAARLAGAKNKPSVEGKRDILSMVYSKYPTNSKLDILHPFRRHARAVSTAAITHAKIAAQVPAGLNAQIKDSKTAPPLNAPSLNATSTAKKAPVSRRRVCIYDVDKNPKIAALWDSFAEKQIKEYEQRTKRNVKKAAWNAYADKQIKEYELMAKNHSQKSKIEAQPEACKIAAAAKQATVETKMVPTAAQIAEQIPIRAGKVHNAKKSPKHLVNKRKTSSRKAIKKFIAHVKAAMIAARKEDKSIRLAVEIVRGKKWSCIIRHRVSRKVTAMCVIPLPRKIGSKIRGSQFIAIPSGQPSHPIARMIRKSAASDHAPCTLQDERWAREQSTKIVHAMFPKAELYKPFPQQDGPIEVRRGHKSAEQVFTILSGKRKGPKAPKRKGQIKSSVHGKA